jgi:hypothetical protein
MSDERGFPASFGVPTWVHRARCETCRCFQHDPLPNHLFAARCTSDRWLTVLGDGGKGGMGVEHTSSCSDWRPALWWLGVTSEPARWRLDLFVLED